MKGKDPELLTNWRTNWLRSIAELSDRSLQERSWFGGPGFENNPHWSFVEFMCSYFDDAVQGDYDHYIHEGFVTPFEAKVLSAFHAAASAYKAPNGEDHNHKAILEDPKWIHVTRLAEDARKALLRTLTDPNERAILMGHEG